MAGAGVAAGGGGVGCESACRPLSLIHILNLPVQPFDFVRKRFAAALLWSGSFDVLQQSLPLRVRVSCKIAIKQLAALRGGLWKIPVSYTHLDVYKRQAYRRRFSAEPVDRC